MAEAKQTKNKKPTIPATAKKPQDRQSAKKDAAPGDTIVEWSGQEYTIPAEAFRDTDVLEHLVEAESGRGQFFILAAKAVLGPEQWLRYKATARSASESGRVSIDDTRDFFRHIMKEVGSGNS